MSLFPTGSPATPCLAPALTSALASLAISSAVAMGVTAAVQGPQMSPQAVCGDPYGGCYPASENSEVRHPLFRNDLPRLSLPSKLDEEMKVEGRTSGEGETVWWIFIGLMVLFVVVCVVTELNDAAESAKRADEEEEYD